MKRFQTRIELWIPVYTQLTEVQISGTIPHMKGDWPIPRSRVFKFPTRTTYIGKKSHRILQLESITPSPSIKAVTYWTSFSNPWSCDCSSLASTPMTGSSSLPFLSRSLLQYRQVAKYNQLTTQKTLLGVIHLEKLFKLWDLFTLHRSLEKPQKTLIKGYSIGKKPLFLNKN